METPVTHIRGPRRIPARCRILRLDSHDEANEMNTGIMDRIECG